MTRINSAIPVKNLTDEHLLAEHREIKRLPWCLENAIKSGSINHIPGKFTLSRGHVLFFLDKLWFCYKRYIDLYAECLQRGFNVRSYHSNWLTDDNHEYYRGNYTPTSEERDLLIERITGRMELIDMLKKKLSEI